MAEFSLYLFVCVDAPLFPWFQARTLLRPSPLRPLQPSLLLVVSWAGATSCGVTTDRNIAWIIDINKYAHGTILLFFTYLSCLLSHL